MKSLLIFEGRVDECIIKLRDNLKSRFANPGRKSNLSDWAKYIEQRIVLRALTSAPGGFCMTQPRISFLGRNSDLLIRDAMSMACWIPFGALFGSLDSLHCFLIS